MGFKPVFGWRGHKHAHCVVNDEAGVRVLKIPVRDFDRAPQLLYRGNPYPPERFRDAMLRIGERKGITQAAVELLMRSEGPSDDAPEDAEPAPTPAATTADPKKPDTAREARPSTPSGGGLIAAFSVEFKLEPGRIRKLLRAAGLAAPYTDAAAIRKALAK